MRKRVAGAVLGGAAAVILVAGASAVAAARDGGYPANGAGQSYGSQLAAPVGQEPDLVLVVATNGREGYVDQQALKAATDPDFKSPSEALAWQEAMAGKVERIPVYLSDGQTPVGEFEITHPTQEQMQEVQEDAPRE